MTKEEILDYFKDINHVYNDCTKYDTLKRMLDELQDPLADAKKYFCTIYELSQKLDVTYDFIDEKIKDFLMREATCVSLTDIQNAPPVTPTEKVEKWIEHKTDDGRSWLECPICHIKKTISNNKLLPEVW